MPILTWSDPTKKRYQSGLDKGTLYVRDTNGTYPVGISWYGLISVSEKPEGAEPTDLWSGNEKYSVLMSPEKFGCTIEAYHSPPEFYACDGLSALYPGLLAAQQERKSFGLAYRTKVFSDGGGEIGYMIHLVYGCVVSPSEVSRATMNESPEAGTFSWEATTTPVEIPGYRSASKITVDSQTADPEFLAWLEEQLWGGTEAGEIANLPLPAAIIEHFINPLP